MPATTRGSTRTRWVVSIAIVALIALFVSSRVCLSTGLSKGLWLDECPDGDLKQVISFNANGLTRGAFAQVTVSTNALYTTGPADQRRSERITSFTPTVALVAAGKETLLAPKEAWKRANDALTGELQLPALNDGEYVLRVRVTSTIGESSIDVPLPLYTPARIHVLTDRPLYEPGNTVKFRALALKANDLSPLEERPGVWTVSDPSGEVLLEEKAPSGKWGVVSGSFPIDLGATSGEWQVTWTSGGVSQSRAFTVKPFTLPRFRIEARSARPFYRRNEKPQLKGTVKYSSGAPVPNAKVELRWTPQGSWPPPSNWADGSAFPRVATTSPAGSFSVDLPTVPDDLQGQATLFASLAVVDSAGDRVEGGASILLSEDPIAVSPVTELASGLVEGMNNRLFLRATTADGRLLEGVTLNVKRLWEPTDKGTDAVVDEDAVGSLQLDPGPAVNVVIPAQPFRPPPRAKVVVRTSLDNLLDAAGDEVTIADRMSFDRLDAKLENCARYVHSTGENVVVGLFVHANGGTGLSALPRGRIGECVGAALHEARFEPGAERLFHAQWRFDDSDLPRLSIDVNGVPNAPSQLQGVLDEALLTARECLPPTVRSGQLPRLLQWRVPAEGKKLDLSWVPTTGVAYPESAVTCITSKLAAVALPRTNGDEENPGQASVGVAHVTITAPQKYEAQRPQETIMTGYEFLVTAKRGKESLGSTRLRMTPGAVPNIRLRASSQIVDPGATVTVEIIRGPDFTGELPDELYLTHAFAHVKAKVDKEERRAQFKVPDDWQGWAGVQWGGGQVILFVRSKTTLALALHSDKPRYAPGQVAQLELETTIGGTPGEAAVGLFGVDDSLSQLVPLPGPGEFDGLRPQPSQTTAFGGIDAQAISLGRVRGSNAAAATLLRISALPPPPQVEAALSVQGQTTFDPNEVLVDHFYGVLGELASQVRDWEAKAPAGERMTNATMARLWNTAIDTLEQRKDSGRDAWGRKLRLHRLPADLLALTEPRQLVINGTRLNEDMQNWAQWVAKEKP